MKRLRAILILIPLLVISLAFKSPKMPETVAITEATAVTAVPEAATPTPEPTATPDPTPTPTPAPDFPVDAEGNFEIYGRAFNLNDEFIDLSHMPISDDADAVAKAIPYMPNLKAVDLDSCGVSNEKLGALQQRFPDKDIIWRINFGENYSVRTNVTKILASMPSKGGTLGNEIGDALKYCTRVRYLDLGHNEDISDFSFVEYMPDLEVAVISMTAVSDLTPFSKCENLLYLEAGNTNISDLSPLAACKKLAHLNVGTCFEVRDISCLYDLPLYRLWLGVGDPVPQEQIDKMRELHPQCEVNTVAGTGLERDQYGNITNEGYTAEGWKYYQNYLTADWAFYDTYNYFPAQRPLGWYKVIHKCFQYGTNPACYSFSWNDPNLEATSHVDPVNTYIVDTSALSEYWEEDPATAHIADVYDDPPGAILVTGTY